MKLSGTCGRKIFSPAYRMIGWTAWSETQQVTLRATVWGMSFCVAPTMSARLMELAMLTALVLVCSAAVAPDLRDCTRYNATAVMRVPAEFTNPATCFVHGQAYLAETSIGQELIDSDHIKVVCVRKETIDASVPLLTVR